MTDELRPAHRSYEALDPTADDGNGLNLAWTRDERECLSVDLDAILDEELRAEIERQPRFLDRYLVRDPYGEATLGPALANAFALSTWRDRVTCGAGVSSLLHGLARLTSPATARFVTDVYPDVPYWVSHSTASSRVWFLERPALQADAFASLDELGALCDDAARDGAVVVVDESNANYYPLAWSALSLARENLAVVRGFSKAYGLGALRLGVCVASPALTERVRTVIAPLLASSLSLRLGARVLALGDITAPLRTRIAEHRREAIERFTRAGIEVVAPSEHLPYVQSHADATAFTSRGLLGKLHPFYTGGRLEHIYRLSVPLNAARMERLRQLL